MAALSELAIPHFTTATIFSVAQGGSDVKFYANVKLLAVSAQIGSLMLPCYAQVAAAGWECTGDPCMLGAQVLSVMYGLFAGLRGFLISLLNTDLIQNLRCASLPVSHLLSALQEQQLPCTSCTQQDAGSCGMPGLHA